MLAALELGIKAGYPMVQPCEERGEGVWGRVHVRVWGKCPLALQTKMHGANEAEPAPSEFCDNSAIAREMSSLRNSANNTSCCVCPWSKLPLTLSCNRAPDCR